MQTNSSSLLLIDASCLDIDTPTKKDLSIYQKMINADLEKSELSIISGEKSIGIAQIREIINKSSYASYSKEMPQLIVIWQAEKITLPAQNALLKILEEPPANFQIILIASTQAHLIETITSRCQLIHFSSSNPIRNKESFQLLDQLMSGDISFARSIQIAEQNSDKDKALELLDQIAKSLEESSFFPSHKATKILQLCREYQSLIQNNINTKLAVAQFLFEAKRSTSNQGP